MEKFQQKNGKIKKPNDNNDDKKIEKRNFLKNVGKKIKRTENLLG